MKRTLKLLFLSAALGGCPAGVGQDKPISTPLSGSVTLVEPIANAHVEVFDFSGAKKGARVAEARSDSKGQWSTDLREIDGPLLVQATEGGLENPLTSVLNAKLEEVHRLSVTPVTHLRSEYARFLMSKGAKFNEAVAQASQQVFGHFAGVNHDSVAPWTDQGERGVTDAMRAHLVAAALEHQSRRLARSQGIKDAGLTQPLLWLLAEDVSADGVFDGAGQGGRQLKLGSMPLSGDTLRADLAVSLIRFAESSDHNKTGLGRADVSALAHHLANSSSPIFPAVASPLVLERPRVSISAPADNSVVGAQVPVACQAEAATDLARMQVTVLRGKDKQEVVSDVHVDTAGGRGNLSAVVDSSSIEDGSASIECVATDRYDNEETAAIGIVINNHAGSVEVRGVQRDQRVSGAIELSCVCADDPESTGCYLALPDTKRGAVVESRPGTFTWDTTKEAEGPAVVECRSESPGLESIVHRVPVFIDNKPDATVCGGVFLESPVRGAVVEAYAWNGERLGTATQPSDQDGAFCVVVRDVYRGPLLLVTTGAGASYASGLDGRAVAVPGGGLSLLLEDYVPNVPLQGLSINGATTVATALAQACRASSETAVPSQCVTQAHDYIGKHLARDGFDVRRAAVRDFVTKGAWSGAAGDESTALGLVHMGLSRLGAETALADKYQIDRLPSIGMVARLTLDAGDGVFDGLGIDHKKIPLTEKKYVTADTFRADLAGAIARWLNNVALDPSALPNAIRNNTNLSALNFSQMGGLLRVMSEDDSRLFPDFPKPKAFDTTGPTINVPATKSLAGELMDLALPQRGVIEFVVQAKDDSGVGRVWLEGEGLVLNGKPGSGPEDVNIALDTRDLDDGPHTLKILATDAVGNTNSLDIEVRVKNTAPVLGLIATKAWVKKGELIRLRVDANGDAIKGFEVTGTGGASTFTGALKPQTSAFDVDFAVNCDQVVEVKVRAWDWAGNESTAKPVSVSCDSHEPIIAFSHSPFTQEKSGYNGSYAPDGSYKFTPNGLKSGTVNLGDGDSILTLEKYAHRLDYLPNEGRTADSENLPLVRFAVSDRGNAPLGAADNELKIEYKYTLQAANGNFDGAWRPVVNVSTDASTIALPIAYQTLLPATGQSLADARAANFIQRASEDDTHIITLRATDLAGNAAEKEFKFKMRILKPHVYVRNCAFHDALKGASFGSGNIAVPFSTSGFPVATGEVVWDFQRSPNSLAAEVDPTVTLNGVAVSTSVDAISWRKGPKRDWDWSVAQHGAAMYSTVAWDDGRHETYRQGGMSGSNGQRGASGSNGQATGISIASLSGAHPASAGANAFVVDGRSRYQVSVTFQNPQLTVDGAPYSPRIENDGGQQKLFYRRIGGMETGTWMTQDGYVNGARPVEQYEWVSSITVARDGFNVAATGTTVELAPECSTRETLTFH